MKARIAINGLGRSGRQALKAILQTYPNALEVVAVNDIGDPKTMAWLFAHDSNYGTYPGTVEVQGDKMVVDGRAIKMLAEREPRNLPWKDLDIDLVLESTGLFTAREKAAWHLEAGAKKVVIGAPAKEPDITVVLGVNETKYDSKKHTILSMASCTTNCAAPVAKVLLDSFGIVKGILTTVHAYTNQQQLLDGPHKDLRRARAAALNMIPTTTGAAQAIALAIPELKGKMDGFAIRVPTPTVSLTDLVVELERQTTLDEIVAAFKAAEAGTMKGILGVNEEPLVSIDFKGDTRSAIVDVPFLRLIEGTMVKVLAWYDNEWGYSTRLADFSHYIAQKGF